VKHSSYADMTYRELKTSLQTLSDQSLKVSRHLDNTYYSILEKVSLWRQTIGSLQELAGLTKELNETFEADTQGLAEDIQGQFEGFDNFDAQQEQVTALEGRIKEGKEKADALHARLAAAQQRIEARAKAEEELETRKIRVYYHCSSCIFLTRRIGRARIAWAILATIASLVLLAILFQQLRPLHPDHETNLNLSFSQRGNILDAPIPASAKEAIMNPLPPNRQKEVHTEQPEPELEDDERLRVFDEL
jgi:hypothetical protein